MNCTNVNANRITFADSSYIDSANGLRGGGGGGGSVNYSDIIVPTTTTTIPGDLETVNVTPTVSPSSTTEPVIEVKQHLLPLKSLLC